MKLDYKYYSKGGIIVKDEIVLFEDQNVKLEVNVKEETVWLSQKQMSDSNKNIEKI